MMNESKESYQNGYRAAICDLRSLLGKYDRDYAFVLAWRHNEKLGQWARGHLAEYPPKLKTWGRGW